MVSPLTVKSGQINVAGRHQSIPLPERGRMTTIIAVEGDRPWRTCRAVSNVSGSTWPAPKEFPQGSSRYGYEFVAPLDGTGHIDTALWKQHRDLCRVRRFAEGEDDQHGFLLHRPGGPEHGRWVFDYDQTAEYDDESGYRFGAHVFRPDEYVSIRREDGEMHTYQVATAKPAA